MNNLPLTINHKGYQGYGILLSFVGSMARDIASGKSSPLTKTEIDVLARLLDIHNKVRALDIDTRTEYVMSALSRKKIRDDMESNGGKPISSANISSVISRLKSKRLITNEPIISHTGQIVPFLSDINLSKPFQINVYLNPVTNGTRRVQELQQNLPPHGEGDAGNSDKIRFNLDSGEGIHGDAGDIHSRENTETFS